MLGLLAVYGYLAGMLAAIVAAGVRRDGWRRYWRDEHKES